MLSILLESKDYLKLEILKNISNAKDPISIRDLSVSLQSENATVKRYVSELNKDFNHFFSNNPQVVEDYKGHYTFQNPTGNHNLNVIENLKLCYFEKTIEFKLLSLLLEKRIYSFVGLASELIISESYVYKLIKKIQPILDVFHLEIDLEGEGNSNFKGKIVDIRLFAYTFCWFTYKNIKWPPALKSVSKHRLLLELEGFKNDQSISNDFPDSNRFYFLLAVIIKYPAVSLDLNPQIINLSKSLLVSNYVPSSFFSYFFSDHDRRGRAVSQEVIFLNVALHIFCQERFSEYDKRSIGSNVKKDKVYSELYVPFLEHIKMYFSLESNNSSEDIIIYYMNLYSIYYFFDIDNVDLFQALPNVPLYGYPSEKERSVVVEIETCWNQFEKKIILSSSKKNHLFDFFYYIITTLRKPKLYIFINNSTFIHGKEFLTTEIFNFFGDEILMDTTDIKKADIVITDSDEFLLNGHQELYFMRSTAPESWEGLITFLQQKIFHLKFEYFK